MPGSAKALHPGTMKATLDELAAGIRSDLDKAKRIEASARRTWHCGWRAPSRGGKPDAAGRVFGLSQERARQLVDMAGVAKESYSVVPSSGTGELPGLRGEGTWAVRHGTEHPLTLNYELD
jgi:Protein of unknown function (DUF3224)